MKLLLVCTIFTYTNALTLENNACKNLWSYPVKDTSPDCFYNPNVMTTTPVMILQNGYQVATYYITTQDGYLLEIFRIPPKPGDNRRNNQPILFVHGIFVDSGAWIFAGNKTLAIWLASLGYDVWLTNQRGTRYSRAHKTLSSAGYKYWLYSIDELAANDVSASVEKIATETGKSGSIIYLGHSRGTTSAFMYASAFPKKAEKMLKGIIALSPIVYLDLVWYLKLLGKLGPLIGNIFLRFGISVFNRNASLTVHLLQHICRWTPVICMLGIMISSGRTKHFRSEDLLAFFSHYPTSIAVMQLIQYAQIYNSDQFQKYDYGNKNLEKYQQPNPPLYDLSNIKIPVYMFYGKHDILIRTHAFEELEDLLALHNICIAVKEKLVKDSGVADESAYDNIVQKLLTKPRARVRTSTSRDYLNRPGKNFIAKEDMGIILDLTDPKDSTTYYIFIARCIIFGSDQEVAGVMRAVRRSNATGSFSWIGSDGWSARSLVSDGNEAEVEGTLSVQPQANPVRGFEEYFLSLNVENNPRNPWFIEFWEHHFQCRYPNSSKTPYNQKHEPLCTGKEKLTRQNTVFEDQLQFVSDAVMAFAYAIRDMHRDLCHGKPGLCDAMKPTKGTELLKYLRKVDFEGLSGDRFHFDSNGDGPARYNIIHFKQVSTGKYRWVRVGEYVEGELRLNMSEIQFKIGHPKPPESVCSFPCDLGQAKKYVEGESCCWHCFNCTQYQILHPKDPTQCIACPQGTVPDPHHIRCEDIPEEYLRPDSGWAIGAMAFSSTGILITMFVCGVFIRHNDTPVVRASGRELSYVLLAGILMCYSVTYALVLRPNDIVCGVQRFGAGFCFTVVYAALLTKTNRISRIFNAGKHSAKRPSFISPRSQLIICSGLVGVQVLINGVWMVISPARAIHHYPTREDNLLVCSSYIDASYMIAFTYPIFLIVICTVYAVLTRKIPEAFNESKHIGFTMYTTCVIWLAFVPLYFGTANHVALRITSMSVTISLSASVTVACLFSPKLYIILIRPERNVRQSMMPMRYSAINKSSATTGSGSMMAAVMVTAATCDQKQQIQKHVPPVEKDEELNDSRVKPETKDISTQTTPHASNNMLNSSQEHLPKINNNCNVGNGPIGILPGVQFKDFSL